MSVELDYMEYSTDVLAQAAYVTSGVFGSDIFTGGIPTSDSNQVGFGPEKAVDDNSGTEWESANTALPHWWKYDLGYGNDKVVEQITIQTSGTRLKNFIFFGSNNDSDWDTLLDSIQAENNDVQTHAVTNSTSYRYYKLQIDDSWMSDYPLIIHMPEIEAMDKTGLVVFSESSIKQQGSYSLKGTAGQTVALNRTLTRTVSPTIDLTDIYTVKIDIRSSRTGSNIKIGIHDSGGTTTEITPNITSANTWQTVEWDISGVSNANKDAIDSIIITIVNADADNQFYIDNIFGAVWGKTLTEILSLGDTYTRVCSWSKTFTETISLTDTVKKAAARIFTETISLTDTVKKAAARIFTETISVADTIVSAITRNRANKLQALNSDKMFPDGLVRNLQNGTDANKAASPVAGDWYIATDTSKVYVCFADGTWTTIYS